MKNCLSILLSLLLFEKIVAVNQSLDDAVLTAIMLRFGEMDDKIDQSIFYMVERQNQISEQIDMVKDNEGLAVFYEEIKKIKQESKNQIEGLKEQYRREIKQIKDHYDSRFQEMESLINELRKSPKSSLNSNPEKLEAMNSKTPTNNLMNMYLKGPSSFSFTFPTPSTIRLVVSFPAQLLSSSPISEVSVNTFRVIEPKNSLLYFGVIDSLYSKDIYSSFSNEKNQNIYAFTVLIKSSHYEVHGGGKGKVKTFYNYGKKFGFDSGDIVQMVANSKKGEVIWEVNGAELMRYSDEILKKNVTWVPFVRMSQKGQEIEWIR